MQPLSWSQSPWSPSLLCSLKKACNHQSSWSRGLCFLWFCYQGKWQIEPRVDNVTRLKPDIDTKYDSLLTSELVELSIIHTSAPSHINTMISTQLHSREIVKHAKYDAYSILLHKTLKSFCLTTYGVFSKEAHEAIYNIANRAKRQNLITSTLLNLQWALAIGGSTSRQCASVD